MASQQQIAANRRNGHKSSGPKSLAGKRRASRNALKHGLAARANTRAPDDSLLDKLAAKIAGKTDDAGIFECARTIAAAELELARVRRVRVGLIEGARVFASDIPEKEEEDDGEPKVRAFASQVKGEKSFPRKDKDVASLHSVLPDLAKLVRYENQAAARRDKAICRLLQLRLSRTDNLA